MEHFPIFPHLYYHLILKFSISIEDDLEKLLTAKSKPSKPLKPAIPAKPNKPVAKPRLKAKPDLKPKPTPKPRFVEGSAGDDELFGTASPSVEPEKPGVTKQKPGSAVQDLFVQGRKPSFNRFVVFYEPWPCVGLLLTSIDL